MNRVIPDLNKNMICKFMIFDINNPSLKIDEAGYIKKMENWEIKCEKRLMELFNQLGIRASVKTDRYSLPHKEEVEVILMGESYINGVYELHRVARQIIKELLNKGVYKIRFYLFCNVVDGNFGFGGMNYKFRYTIH